MKLEKSAIEFKVEEINFDGVADSKSPWAIQARSRAINRHAYSNLARTVAWDIEARICKVGSWRYL